MEPRTERLQNYLTGFFLSKQAEGCSPNTIIEYKKDFAHFSRWCEEHSKDDPLKLTPADFKSFLADLRLRPNGRGKLLSPKTIYNAWVALRSFYRWAAEETGKDNAMLAVPAPKAPITVIEPLTKDQVSSILKACDSTESASTCLRSRFTMRRTSALRDKPIVLTLLDAGIRASELCNLAIEDVDLASGRVLVRRGKGGKGRITYLGKAARRGVWRYLSQRGDTRQDDPLFVTREDRLLNTDQLVKLFHRLGIRAGVPNLHPHRLRHSFATEFLRNGGNVLGLQRLLSS